MAADYDATLWCAGASAAPDAVFAFHSSQATQVRVRAQPEAGYDTVIALFDGSTGAPLRDVDDDTVLVDLTDLTVACGDGWLDWIEECDDGNTAAGDGCDPNCLLEYGDWRCPDPAKNNGVCDCGCGALDPECPDAEPDSCESCPFSHNCSRDCFIEDFQPGTNYECIPPA
jgi:cysteine-rich repeat protein